MKQLLVLILPFLLMACGGSDVEKSTKNSVEISTSSSVKKSTQDFSSIKDFTLISSGFREYQGQPSAWVMFSKPVDKQTNLNNFLNLRDSHGIIDGGWQLDNNGNNAYFINIKPAHEYTITVRSNLPSFDQQVLSTSSHKTFTSPDIGAAAFFLHKGSILNPKVSAGLPIMVVNLPYVDVDYYRVDSDYYLQLLSRTPNAQSYSWTIERLTNHATLVFSQKYKTSAAKNKKIKQELATTHITALQQSGVYLAVMRAPSQYESYQVAYFTVSSLGTEVRQYKNSYLVTVSNQNSGLPVAGVSVATLDDDNKQLGVTQTTDANGQVTINKIDKRQFITLTKGDDFNVFPFQNYQTLQLDDFDLGYRKNSKQSLFFFGARDLYRRGEDIRYYAIIRDDDGRAITNAPLKASLVDPQGNEIVNTLLTAAKTYQFDHHMSKDALTGRYTLNVTLGHQTFSHHFNVEDFMPQRIEIKFPAQEITLTKVGDSKQALTGLFLYGAPTSAHKSDGLLQLTTTDKALPTHPGYYFGQHNDMGTLQSYDIDAIELDQQGLGALELADRWSKYQHPIRINGYANLYEKGGRKVTSKFSQLWWPKESLIGIKPHFKKLTSESEQEVEFSLLRTNFKSEMRTDKVLVSLIRHHQEFYWQHSNQGGWQRLERNNIYPVWQKELTLSDAKALTISAPVSWGKYQLKISSLVDDAKASLFFNAGDDWYWRWSENNGNSVRPDQIKLAPNKASYQDGDIANVKIDSPYAGQAWLRIESDKLLWQKQVTLKQGQNQLEIPISDWHTHNVYLSAYLISPSVADQPLRRALGLSHLKLDRQTRHLTVSLSAPEKVKSDQPLTVKAQVAGATKNTRVVLAAVDVGILNLHNFKTPDPFNFFFGQRQYDVVLSDNFDRIIKANDYAKAQLLWGGGAEMARGGEQASADVQIVSYLSQPILVNEQGIANFSVPVPYFNGRLRLFAIAYDEENYGHVEQPLTVSDDLISQISMPRFLALGDKASLNLQLSNTTEHAMQLNVAVSSSGLSLSTQQSITLQAKQQINLSLAVHASKIDSKTPISLSIKGKVVSDKSADDAPEINVQRQWQLAVRGAYPAQRFSQSLTLKPQQSHDFTLGEFKDSWQSQTQSSISIATRPQFDLADQVNKLFQFPLGCLEQTSSRIYPWMNLPPKPQTALQQQLPHIKRDELIDSGIKRILSMQGYNGGLSLWHSSGNEYAWLSVYGAQILLQAKENGIYVPEVKLEKLLKRLSYYLRRGNFSGYGDVQDYRFATRAYSALVLAQLSRANQSHMRQLQQQISDSRSPYPVVQLAMAFKLMGDQRRANQLFNSAKTMSYRTSYNDNYASEIRDKAMIISLLLTNSVEKDWAQTLAFELWQDKKSRHWFSTQERLALILADNQLAAHFDQDFDYQLEVANATFSGPEQHSAFYRVDGKVIEQSKISNTSVRSIYVTQTSQGIPIKAPAPISDGITIIRDYYTMDGSPVQLRNVDSGQQFIVRIRLRSKKGLLRNVMVVDLLPAGFEIENSLLADSADFGQVLIDNKALNYRRSTNRIDYQGARDDRFVASVSASAHSDTELFYVVQAVTPGTYQRPPIMAESMYRADIRAVGDNADLLRIK